MDAWIAESQSLIVADMSKLQAVSFLNLKPVTPNLLPAVVELDKLCFGGLWTLEGYQRELNSPNSDLLVLLPDAEQGSRGEREKVEFKISTIFGIGSLWAILEEAHITMLAVHPDYRHQGFGQVLLLSLLVKAKQRGLERATLEVRISNQAALSLYEKFGFRIAGQRRGYYQDTGEDALILWLSGIQYPQFDKNLANWEGEIRSCLAKSGWKLHPDAIEIKN